MNNSIVNLKSSYRVGIYLRLSNEDRDKDVKSDDSESIKNQRNMLIDYINKFPEFILVDEYCDEDLSGAGTFRPEFERLIDDCKNSKLDIVLCKSQSRFSRDMEIVEKYINNKFKEWNVRFIGLTDNADTNNFGNKKARQINGLVNEWYLEDVSNNIRSAFYSKMRRGEFISPFAAFGYNVSNVNNNKLVIDPVAALVVKEIFNLYIKGLGFTGVAKYLNQKNIPCPSLYKYYNGVKLNVVSKKERHKIKWSGNAVKSILTNEVYLGHLIQGKRTTISYKNHKVVKKDRKDWIRIENTHEAIIDNETFKKVQLAIKNRTKPMKATNMVHIFSGKVYCLECNSYLRKKKTSKHEYLTCSSNDSGCSDCVNKNSIRYDILESFILNKINEIVDKYYDISMIDKEYIKKNKADYNDKIKFLIKKKEDLKNESLKINLYLKNIYEDRINGILDLEQFSDLANSYKKEKIALSKQIKAIDDEILVFKKRDSSIKNYKNVFYKYKKFESLNRIIIDEFIDKIYVGKLDCNKRDIYVKWNI